jgi:hypothetical protein
VSHAANAESANYRFLPAAAADLVPLFPLAIIYQME